LSHLLSTQTQQKRTKKCCSSLLKDQNLYLSSRSCLAAGFAERRQNQQIGKQRTCIQTKWLIHLEKTQNLFCLFSLAEKQSLILRSFLSHLLGTQNPKKTKKNCSFLSQYLNLYLSSRSCLVAGFTEIRQI
jgi:hypothetical protein